MNIRQVKAIEAANKKKLLVVNPNLNENSGIYFLTRVDENNIKYAYIGQAKHILTRLAQHLSGYQHIDLSLKKWGLHSTENLNGWKVNFIQCPIEDLDAQEQYYIRAYANGGYQLRNKTAGGQGEGKAQIDEYRASKGYRDGIKQGYKNASKEISHLFDLHLNVTTKSEKLNKNQEKALQKFKDFLDYHKNN